MPRPLVAEVQRTAIWPDGVYAAEVFTGSGLVWITGPREFRVGQSVLVRRIGPNWALASGDVAQGCADHEGAQQRHELVGAD
jgi:hypothetical protein